MVGVGRWWCGMFLNEACAWGSILGSPAAQAPRSLHPLGEASSALQSPGAPGKWSLRSLCSRLWKELKRDEALGALAARRSEPGGSEGPLVLLAVRAGGAGGQRFSRAEGSHRLQVLVSPQGVLWLLHVGMAMLC